MPKIKTNKGASKRFKLTGSGKIKFRRANRNHILTKKDKTRKRQIRALGMINHADENSVLRQLVEK